MNLVRRIEKLEQQSVGLEDADLLAYGETVTDAELRRLAEGSHRRRLNYRRAMGISDVALWRFLKTAIEANRQDNEGTKR